MRKLLLASGSICILISSAGGRAAAQTVSPTSPVAEPVSTLAEVVVTAQRRAENLQKTAMAVNAVTGGDLQDKGVTAPQDLTKLVPALNIEALSGGSLQVTVRGVGSFAGNAQTEAGVAINYDGIYVARPQGANGLFYDLERVEVLKGPQGTLYGRNSTAGALNIITRKPTFDGYHVDANLDIGNYDLVHGGFAANMPINDTAALRISADGVSRSGYLSDGYNDDKHWGARAQLLLKPTDQWSILVSTDYTKIDGKGAADVLKPFLNPSNPWEGPSTGKLNAVLASTGLPLPPFTTKGFVNDSVWGASGTIEYRPGNVVLTLIPAYRQTDVNDFHYGAGFPVSDTVRSKETTLEGRIASDGNGSFKWLAGGYYFHEATPYTLLFDQGVAQANNNLSSLDTTSVSGFGQATYSVTQALRLTAGARYTSEHKTQSGNVISSLPPVPPAFYPFVCPSPATLLLSSLSCNAPTNGDVTFSQTTWKIGADYDLRPNSLLYVNIGTGFKAGGFFNSLPPNNVFQPEKLTAYTVGSKNRFWGNTVQFNLEGFYWKYDNKQVSHLAPVQPAGFNLVTDNAGSATLYGIDIDAIWQATPDDRFSVDVEYVHSRYDSFKYKQTTLTGPPATGCAVVPITGQASFVTIDCSGRTLSFSPEEIANLGYDHTFRLQGGASLVASASTRIQSGSWLGDEFLPGEYQQSNTTTDARLTWNAPSRKWSLGAYVENIENGAVGAGSFVQPVIAAPLVVLRPPRTYGMRASFHY